MVKIWLLVWWLNSSCLQLDCGLRLTFFYWPLWISIKCANQDKVFIHIWVISWQPRVEPCMHGGLSTQKTEIGWHSVTGKYWEELKELSRHYLLLVASDLVVAWASKLLYLQAKRQLAQTAISLLFHSIPTQHQPPPPPSIKKGVIVLGKVKILPKLSLFLHKER